MSWLTGGTYLAGGSKLTAGVRGKSTMPHYFFDLTDAGVFTRDAFGSECDDDQAARNLAISLLFYIARDEVPDSDHHERVATVRTEAGQVVYEANLSLSGRWWPGQR